MKIKIYYLSLCQFARELIIDHLHPVFKSKLGKYIDIEFLPTNNKGTVIIAEKDHLNFCFSTLLMELEVGTLSVSMEKMNVLETCSWFVS